MFEEKFIYILKDSPSYTHLQKDCPYQIGGGSSTGTKVRLYHSLEEAEKARKRWFPKATIHKFKFVEEISSTIL